MNEDQVRQFVRDAISRRLADAAPAHAGPGRSGPHPSHGLYRALVNAGEACLIEPAVPCNHCGYCKSHGH